ncbi:MAG TPA: acyl-CoA dehydrogenase family protein [Acidimicrobiales bacterium]|nr:acyl-CoA dehydrogenase family protein [Acidimicrobiales bacterium]
MNPDLPAEAVEFGAAARKAFDALGAVDSARRAELDPDLRGGEIAATLASLGAADVDPTGDLDTALAAAELCRAAGRVALPYPVPGVLLSIDGRPFAVVSGSSPVDHGDLFPAWTVAGLDGSAHAAVPGRRLATRLGPFVTPVTMGDAAGSAPRHVLLHLTLTGWTVLGALERAIELAVDHVRERIQFGKPLATFQAVQFQLADAAVAVDGLRELCRYTMWRVFADPDAAGPDALALRLAALDTARPVLRTAQQLFGAAGVCEEYDVSVIARHLQPALRLPCGPDRTAAALVAAVRSTGFESLFPHGGR